MGILAGSHGFYLRHLEHELPLSSQQERVKLGDLRAQHQLPVPLTLLTLPILPISLASTNHSPTT